MSQRINRQQPLASSASRGSNAPSSPLDKRGIRGGVGGVLVCVALAAFAGTAVAAVETATWKGGNMADWNTASNWDPEVVPTNSAITQYDVVINNAAVNPEGPFISNLNVTINKLTVSETDSFVEIRDGGTLKISNSGGLDNKGTITVKAGGKLTLNGGTSKSKLIKLVGIEGTAKRAKLRIDSDTTLDEPSLGVGCEILGEDGTDDTSGPGCPMCPGPTPEVPDGLIEGNVNATLTMTANGTIRGELEINAALTNNGLVDANDDEGKIFLTGASKSSGSGADFKATAGLLEVDTDVTGSANWTVQETGFLFIDQGDIEGTDLDVLKINGTNPWMRMGIQRVSLSGNLDVTMTGGNTDDCQEEGGNPQWGIDTIKMTGGTPESPVTLEIASVDICIVGGGWDVAWPFMCMGMGKELIIGADAHVKVVNVQDNENTGGDHCPVAECLLVTNITFVDSDGRLDRNGIDTHYSTLTGNVSQLLGSQECGDCP